VPSASSEVQAIRWYVYVDPRQSIEKFWVVRAELRTDLSKIKITSTERKSYSNYSKCRNNIVSQSLKNAVSRKNLILELTLDKGCRQLSFKITSGNALRYEHEHVPVLDDREGRNDHLARAGSLSINPAKRPIMIGRRPCSKGVS